MSHSFCPGAKLMRQPRPEDMSCPHCGAEVEIWSDEVKAKCGACGKTVMRDGSMSCLDWCKMGKECVGDEVYDRYVRNKEVCTREQLLAELESWFGEDTKRVEHAKKVKGYAEELLHQEGGDWHIVIPASILHDVGIKVAEEKYGSSAGKYQEQEGPPVALKILRKIGLLEEHIQEICDIIASHHSPGRIKTRNFEVLYDADCLVNMAEALSGKSNEQIDATIERVFLTASGKEMARKLYLP